MEVMPEKQLRTLVRITKPVFNTEGARDAYIISFGFKVFCCPSHRIQIKLIDNPESTPTQLLN